MRVREPYKKTKSGKHGFTIVELMIVVAAIAILASISVVVYRNVQIRSRDAGRMSKLDAIADAIELYKSKYGKYPPILDAQGQETTSACSYDSAYTTTDHDWGHCNRNKQLADMLSPWISIAPESLSDATQGNYYYRYTSQASDNYQTYGMMVFLEGTGGANDGGYYANAYEVGDNPTYCRNKYTGTNGNWISYTARCTGGD